MIGIIFYMIFVAPVAYKTYLRNAKITGVSKILNLAISFILFVFFFYEFKTILVTLIQNGFYPERLSNTLLYFSEYYIYISYYLYFIASLIICSLLIWLGRGNNNGRKLFVKYFKFLIPVVCNFSVLIYYNIRGFYKGDLKAVLLLIFIVFILLFLIYFIYNSKLFNPIFHNNSEEQNHQQ